MRWYYHILPIKAEGPIWKKRLKDFRSKRWWMTPRKQHFPQLQQSWFINKFIQTAIAFIKPTQVHTRQKFQHKEGEVVTKHHPYLRIYLQFIASENVKMIFLQWIDTGYINHSPREKTLCSWVATEHKWNSMFCFCFVCFCCVVVHVWYSLLCEEKERTWSWVDRKCRWN